MVVRTQDAVQGARSGLRVKERVLCGLIQLLLITRACLSRSSFPHFSAEVLWQCSLHGLPSVYGHVMPLSS